jgi:hypothetical protein
LAKIISKLVDHDIGSNRQHKVDQAFQECFSLWRLWHTIVISILDHLLEHAAAGLIKAVEVESVENLHFLLGQHSHLILDILRDGVIHTNTIV